MNYVEMARNIAGLFLQNEERLTRDKIEEIVIAVCERNDLPLSDPEREGLIRDLESTYQTVIGRESEMRPRGCPPSVVSITELR